ncbi:hypothetical protein NB311A_10288 [Nitrobacter sp. Nb-311A]|uniref:hypothetical protein n=1 Tax=Nitrobacter sp. Nb-311A TaxID=314253 RepID=UPI0000684EEB|nr:hypothetical protein [Nitrobacter sp. Nb-311A]EAQ34264.1 hypothetical protein NB311A_10288 [Nitrobacter sp. Nb-311A]
MYLKYRDVLDIFMNRLPVTEENDDVLRANAECFFRACIECLRNSDEVPAEWPAISQLNQIELGYACWLQEVRSAIEAARSDFPPQYASYYERFLGAAAMAQVYLLNVDLMEELAGEKLMLLLKRHAAR